MDRFVVGTGRCGSTLLSSMLGRHPAVTSVFEYLNGLDVFTRFQEAPMSGEDFTELITREQPVITAVVRRGYPVAEVTYPFEPVSRHRPEDGLPWILVSLLPALSDDPDALFDAVVERTRAFPPRPAPAQHRAFLELLAGLQGRAGWIERSGSSIDYLGALAAAFPQARFLHLHRDGAEVALSMREHHAYRLPISFMYRAPLDDGSAAPPADELDFAAPASPGDAIDRILRSRPPVAIFGQYWSDQLVHGMPAAHALPAERYREVAFEDLITGPHEALGAIAEFFELEADPAWLADAAALIRGDPPLRVPELESEAREALERACEPGRRALADR